MLQEEIEHETALWNSAFEGAFAASGLPGYTSKHVNRILPL